MIGEGLRLHELLRSADEERLWNPGLPNPGATAAQLDQVTKALGYQLDRKYRSFLENANGWSEFYQTVSIFGTDDILGSPLMDVAWEQMRAIGETAFRSNTGLAFAHSLPIAATEEDADMFVLAGPEAPHPGEVLWVAGYVIERYRDFDSFYRAMLGYNRRQIADLGS